MARKHDLWAGLALVLFGSDEDGVEGRDGG